MKAPLFILVLLFCLPACASRHDRRCRKAAKRIERAVELCPQIARTDTFTIHDTVTVQGVQRVDTFVTTLHDTVRIDTGRLHVRIVRRVDTLLVDARCDPDTVFVRYDVEVPGIDCPPVGGVADWWRTVALVLAVLVVLSIVLRTLKPL